MMEILTGITTFVFMVFSMAAGMFMRKLQLKIFHHKLLAGLALVFGILHILFVFVL
ncbi:MAG: hypothetical protein AB7T10_00925 [bacterium]